MAGARRERGEGGGVTYSRGGSLRDRKNLQEDLISLVPFTGLGHREEAK